MTQQSPVKRTEGSWRVDSRAATRIVAGEDDTVATTGCQSNLRDQWEGNAQTIVLAVNAHPALVEALEDARGYIDSDKYGDAIARIDAALQLVRGEGK